MRAEGLAKALEIGSIEVLSLVAATTKRGVAMPASRGLKPAIKISRSSPARAANRSSGRPGSH